ncbi:MAG: lysylphosphatidylglycerol synthase transmembrane domain-containing protein [Saprospiraceae bacterium]
MSRHLSNFAKISIFMAFGLGILYLVYLRQETAYQADCAIKGTAAGDCSLINKIFDDITHAHFFWVFITMIIFMISNVFRALRWEMMLQAIGYHPRRINLLGTIMINYLANLGIPRSGEIVRAGLISNYENIPVEKALGTIFTDRIFDVIMLVIVIILAILFGGNDFLAYVQQNMNVSDKINMLFKNPVLSFITGLAICTIFIFIWKKRDLLISSPIGLKVSNLFKGFADGVQSVRKVSSIPLFIFYTLAIWMMYYVMLYFAFFSFDPTSHLGPIAGLVVFVFGSLGIVIPTPGGMGSYHFLVGEALAMYDINGVDAFSFANIVFFSIQIFVNIFFGVMALVILPIINKDKI